MNNRLRNATFYIAFINVLLWKSMIFAQAPDTMWTKTYGGTNYDFGMSVQQTTDGGYIIGGETMSYGVGAFDIWLIKIDVDGDTIWTRTYGGVQDDWCRSVQQTTDGGYIIAGSTKSFGAGSIDAYIIRVNTNGDTLWTKVFGGPNLDFVESVQQTTDGGYIIAGSTESFGAGSRDVWLIRTDENGDTLWSKTYGGVDYDRGGSVQQTSDSGYIVVGATSSFGAGVSDVWLIKTDIYGDTLWTRTFGGTAYDFGDFVQQTSDGGYITTGFTESYGAGFRDVWLIRTNANGDTLWSKTYGGVDLDRGNSVQQTSDGGYIVAGFTFSFGAGDVAFYLIRTDENGDTLWTNTFGGDNSDMCQMAQQTSDDGYIIVGSTNSFGLGESDIWLIKVASDTFALEEKNNTIPDDFHFCISPNPANKQCRIDYILQQKERIGISIFDICGRFIKEIMNDIYSVGKSHIVTDISDLPAGVYFVRLSIKNYSKIKKVIIID